MVNNEVHQSVTKLVNELYSKFYVNKISGDSSDQLTELSTPKIDYKEAAIAAGFASLDEHPTARSWQELCNLEGVEPYEKEICEYWLVSNRLAVKLAEKGETVVRDFMGLDIWGRTTTNQNLVHDSIILDIHSEI